jgi:hypothetical protein
MQVKPSSVIEIRQRARRGESTIWTFISKKHDETTMTPASSNALTSRSPSNWTITRIIDSDKKITSTTTAEEFSSSLLQSSSNLTIKDRIRHVFTPIRDFLTTTLLPKSYPHSVTPDYLPYTLWQFAHSVSGTVTGTLSTQALLQALGMGAGSAIGLAATTNWIIKDGFGLLGGVLYAGMMGSKFDSHPKKYRFLSAVAIQLSTFAELLTPLVPALFLPMASASNVGKNIGWLASSATRASIHRGFAKWDNLGDITAKAGAQATLAGLMGTALGIGVSWGFGTDPWSLMQVFVPLSCWNLWCCYKANDVVVTKTLNVERGETVLKPVISHILDRWVASKTTSTTSRDLGSIDMESLIPLPALVSKQEVFIRSYKSHFHIPLEREPPLAPYISQMQVKDATLFMQPPMSPEPHYRLLVSKPPPTTPIISSGPSSLRTPIKSTPPFNSSAFTSILPGLLTSTSTKHGQHHKIQVAIWFLDTSEATDHLKGFYHACLIRELLNRETYVKSLQIANSLGDDSLEDAEFVRILNGEIIPETSRIVEQTFDELETSLKNRGWLLRYTHLADKDARIVLPSSSADVKSAVSG